jgi:hypothetical protein
MADHEHILSLTSVLSPSVILLRLVMFSRRHTQRITYTYVKIVDLIEIGLHLLVLNNKIRKIRKNPLLFTGLHRKRCNIFKKMQFTKNIILS